MHDGYPAQWPLYSTSFADCRSIMLKVCEARQCTEQQHWGPANMEGNACSLTKP